MRKPQLITVKPGKNRIIKSALHLIKDKDGDWYLGTFYKDNGAFFGYSSWRFFSDSAHCGLDEIEAIYRIKT